MSSMQLAFTMKIICMTLILFVSQVFAEECKKKASANCECSTSKHTIKLDGYDYASDPKFKEQPAQRTTDTAKYSYDPCVGLTFPTTAPGPENPCNGAAVCQHTTDNSYFEAGSLSTHFDFYGDPERGDLRIEYHSLDGQRTSGVKLQCKNDGNPTLEVQGETATQVYNFTLQTKVVCFADPSSPTGGLSTGSILLIIFFVLLLVYIIGGMLYLRFAHGARGVEQIPNYDFWLDFPALVKDGVVFVSRGCKPEPSYQQI